MEDPSYLPPPGAESPDTSPAPDRDRERSLTPFLRSQGRADGHGLVFHSRISPSPNRSLHRRRRHKPSRASVDSDSLSETGDRMSRRSIREEMAGNSDEADRSVGRKNLFPAFVRSEQSVKTKSSKSVTSEARRERRVIRQETITESSQSEVRLVRTSDYSSQSDSEAVLVATSTPKNTRLPGTGLGYTQGSPRLRVWEGEDWLWSPRTPYTYAQGLTYRSAVTPGREIAMPHMARLPLYGFPQATEHTELWEVSEMELSGPRPGVTSPHLVYRRQVNRRPGYWATILNYLLLLPLWLLAIAKSLFYHNPVNIWKKIKSSSSVNIVVKTLSVIFTSLWRIPLNMVQTLHPLNMSFRSEASTKILTQDSDDILTEDEEETGGVPVISETDKSEASFIWRHLISSWTFVTSILCSFKYFMWNKKTISNGKVPKRVVFKDIPDMPHTGAIDPYISEDDWNVSEERQHDIHYVEENGELLLNTSNSQLESRSSTLVKPVRKSSLKSSIVSVMVYPFVLFQMVTTSAASSLININGRNEEFNNKLSTYDFLTEDEDKSGLNSFLETQKQISNKVKRSKKLRGSKERKPSWREWFFSFLYRKKPVRRSRRLRGLDPEQVEHIEKKRRLRKARISKSTEKEESVSDTDNEDCISEEEEEEELIIATFLRDIAKNVKEFLSFKNNANNDLSVEDEQSLKNVTESTKDTGERGSKGRRLPWREWFFSFLYRKKQIRRSRRLQGLDPEQVELIEKKKRLRKARIPKSTEKEERLSDTDNDISVSEMEEEEELIIAAYLKDFANSVREFLTFNNYANVDLSVENEQILNNVTEPSRDTGENKSFKERINHFPLETISRLLTSFFLHSWFKKCVTSLKNIRVLFCQVKDDKHTKSDSQSHQHFGKQSRQIWVMTLFSSYFTKIMSILKSVFYKTHVVRCKTSENEVPRGWFRKTVVRTKTRPIEETEEQQVEEQEFRLLYLLRLTFQPIKNILLYLIRDQSLSARNLRRHDQEMSEGSEGSIHNVATWIRDQCSSTTAPQKQLSSDDDNSSNNLKKLETENQQIKSSEKNKASRKKILWFFLILGSIILALVLCRQLPQQCTDLTLTVEKSALVIKDSFYEAIFSLKDSVIKINIWIKDALSGVMELMWISRTKMVSSGSSMVSILGKRIVSVMKRTLGFLQEIILWLNDALSSSLVQCISYLKSLPQLMGSSFSATTESIWTLTSEITNNIVITVSRGGKSLIANLICICQSTWTYTSESIKMLFSNTSSFVINQAIAIRDILMFYSEVTKMCVVNSSNEVYSLVINSGASIDSVIRSMQQTVSSSIYQLKDWIWTLELPKLMWDYPQISSLGSSLSEMFSSLTLIMGSAWTMTMSFLPTKPIMQETDQTLDYDKIISTILNNENFLTKVHGFANQKIEDEKKSWNSKSENSEVKIRTALESYNEQINKLKTEVQDETKKVSEQLFKLRSEDGQKSATEQELIFAQMREKYEAMWAQVEKIQQDQTASVKENHGDLLRQIDELKKNILTLSEQQKELQSTLVGCCNNQTKIEDAIEKHISEFLDGVKSNNSNSELAKWINSIFVAKSEIEMKLKEITLRFEENVKHTLLQEMRNIAKIEADQTAQHIMATVTSSIQTEFSQRQTNKTQDSGSSLSKEDVSKIVKNALIQYDADKTGMFDYALETAGGSVISTRCTETFVQKTAMYSIFGIPIWYPPNNPRTVIQPGVQPGECWAFKGSTGFIVIQLADAVIPTRFSMEHISRTMSPSGRIDSAPREFVVYGLRSETDKDPVKLGSYSYSELQDPLQYFEVETTTQEAYPFIELDILSNHGNINYTCLYRFRVHGVLP